MGDVWKWVAGIAVAFLLGAGGTNLLGTAALNQHKGEAQAEVDKLELKVDEILEAVYTTKGILETEFAIHHPDNDHTFAEALRIPDPQVPRMHNPE